MTTVWHAPADEVRMALAHGVVSLQKRPARAAVQRPEFASPDHERFYDSQAPEIVASAWMGAGKSRILVQKAWDLARTYPGSTLGIFRKIAASLPATTARTFWRDVADVAWIRGRNRSENWVELVNGSRIYFMGLDPDPITGIPSKVGSLDLDWAGVDEAVELTFSDWMVLSGRLRRTSMPYRQLAAVTNPASPTHWLKRHFTPPSDAQEWITITENRFLPDDYRARLETLGTGAIADRLARGIWIAAEGQIWTLPDDQVRSLPAQKWRRVIAGLDWGYQHAFACEVGVESGMGRHAIVDELYARGRTVPSLIPDLIALRDKWGIETFYADPSEPAYIEECRQAGLSVAEATNDVLPGITAVTEEIAQGLLIAPECTGLLSEIPGYVWAMERSSGQPKDVPVKMGDDACDALRYLSMAWRRTISGQFSLVA